MNKIKMQKVFLLLSLVLILLLAACIQDAADEIEDIIELEEPYFEDFDISFINEQIVDLLLVRPEHWGAHQSNPFETLEENIAAGLEVSFWDPTFDNEPSIVIHVSPVDDDTPATADELVNLLRPQVEEKMEFGHIDIEPRFP